MATKHTVRDVIQPAPADQDDLSALEAALARVPENTAFSLSGPDTAPVVIPEPLYRVLCDAVAILRQGAAVVISPLQRRLSTTEAGDFLGVSRQYLTRLLDRGDIPCDRTGRHRRIKLSDILDYKTKRDDARREFLQQFTAESAEAGDYSTARG